MTEAEWLASTDPAAMLAWINGSSWADTSHEWDRRISARKLRLFGVACCRSVWHLLTDPRSRAAVEVAERYADGEATDTDLGRGNFWGAEAVIALRGTGNPSRNMPWRYASAAQWTCHQPDVQLLAEQTSAMLEAAAPQAAILRDIVGNPWRPFVRERTYLTDAHANARVVAAACMDLDRAGLRGRTTDKAYRRNVESMIVCEAWLTPAVLGLAQAAYDERPGVKCLRCQGRRGWWDAQDADWWRWCDTCDRTGSVADGRLDPHRLAVLADALEDAGCEGTVCKGCEGTGKYRHGAFYGSPCDECDERGIVPHPLPAHLRSAGPHWRGMWSLDLILSKG